MTSTVRITSRALDTIGHVVAAHRPTHTETGGILLGHLSGIPEIATAGDPGPNAVHTPNRFQRDLIHAQRLAADAWLADGTQWIGEWHTHPRSPLVPSTYDLATYRGLLARPGLRLPSLVAVIATPAPVAITAWQVLPTELRALNISRIE